MILRTITAALISTAVLGACAPLSRVTLLPEDGGVSGAVDFKTKDHSTVLSRPYQTASVGRNGGVSIGETNAATVAGQYKLLLSQQPLPAQRFTLRFLDGARLMPESESDLVKALAHAAQRPGSEIFVTGHTDSVGSVESNDALSLQRAKVIRDRLVSSGFKPDLIEAIGRGERELLIPTADETEEPKNRRAELVVR